MNSRQLKGAESLIKGLSNDVNKNSGKKNRSSDNPLNETKYINEKVVKRLAETKSRLNCDRFLPSMKFVESFTFESKRSNV